MGPPFVSTWDGESSPHEQELLRLHVTPSLQTVEVDTAGTIGGVELDFVVASFFIAVYEFCNLLTKRVEDNKRNV